MIITLRVINNSIICLISCSVLYKEYKLINYLLFLINFVFDYIL